MILKLRVAVRGRHVHADVFTGPDADHLASNGTLVMLAGEWQLFGAMALLGADKMPDHLEVVVDFPDERGQLERAIAEEDACP